MFVYTSHDEQSGAPDALIRAGVLYRVVKDQLGSVRLVVNATTGEVAQSIDYDAYGRVLNETGAGFQPFGFAGGLYDADTKLVRFGARDYDPGMGRFTNRDPIGFAGQQGNQYLYVDGEPVNRRDPRGLGPEDGCIMEKLETGLLCLVAIPLSVTSGPCGAILAGSSCGFAVAKWYLCEQDADALAQKELEQARIRREMDDCADPEKGGGFPYLDSRGIVRCLAMKKASTHNPPRTQFDLSID